MTTNNPHANCPLCQTPSSRVHSSYNRTISDLPWAEYTVRLLIKIRRFFCTNNSCKRLTFAESLGGAILPWARNTTRRATQLQNLGLALGGEAGARSAVKLGIKTSPDTILRLIRTIPLPPIANPKIVGIDDWAFRKAQSYGTIVVDLERQKAIELLPDRESATVAKWLVQHPTIEVISRDRAVVYAEAARVGAPQARQIVDRFHLTRNLNETVEKVLKRNYATIRQTLATPAVSAELSTKIVQSASTTAHKQTTASAEPKLTWYQNAKQARLVQRQQILEQVRQMAQAGANQSEIAETLAISSRRVRELLKKEGVLPSQPYKPRASPLDPYKKHLHQRFFEEDCHNATLLWEEIRAQGYRGALRTVKQYVHRLRSALPNATPANSAQVVGQEPPIGVLNQRQYSTSKLVWWFVLEPAKLSASQQAKLEALCRADQKLALSWELAQSFKQMFILKKADDLTEWLHKAQQSGINEWVSFARGLLRDEDAVKASITLPWSQGIVEGTVNKLKLIKRSMYGRAKLDLLKIRLLAS